MSSLPAAADLRDYVDFSLETPVGRRVFATDVLAVDVLSLEPGQTTGVRAFGTADLVYTVVAGLAWLVTEGHEVTLQPLQAALVPAGVAHGLRNDSADPLIVQAVSSPPDEAPQPPHGPVGRATQVGGPAPTPVLSRLRRILGGDSDGP